MENNLTQEMIDAYRDSGGNKCLFCESEDVSATPNSFESDGIEGTNEVECFSCGAQWRDLYLMVGVGFEDQFPNFTKPAPAAEVTDWMDNDHANFAYLATVMYPPGNDMVREDDMIRPVVLEMSITEIDEMSKEAYDMFIERSKASAAAWNATFTNEGWTWDDIVKGWCKDELGGE